jgi:hypothetical protein
MVTFSPCCGLLLRHKIMTESICWSKAALFMAIGKKRRERERGEREK